MDNLNDISPKLDDAIFSMFGLTNPWAKDMTFKQTTLVLRMLDQAFGGFIFAIYLLDYQNSLSSNTQKFMGAYIVQRFAKIILFGLKYSGLTNNWVTAGEVVLFAGSALLNLAQLYYG